jgi:hypothetical protein
MTIDTKELRRLAQAVSGWSNCNQAWLDQSEDVPAAAVGQIDEDGNIYPIATIDCDQYYAAHQSLPLAKFYAAANPAVISELLDRLEAAEKERDFAKTEIARLHDDIRELTDVRVLDEEDRDRIVAWRQGTSAKPALSTPEGWRLVPIVSTEEMDNAGSEHCDGYLSTAQAVWDAMLAAAPEAKP